MAPEQARGEPVDARADVFALGGLLAAVLTGKAPFAGSTVVDTVRKAADANLTVVRDELGSRYVNVDTSTVSGIARAKELGLVESGLADVVVTQYLYAGAALFNPRQRGR